MVAHTVKFDLPEPDPAELTKRIGLALSLLNWRTSQPKQTIQLSVAALLGATLEDLVEIEKYSRGDYPEPGALTLGA